MPSIAEILARKAAEKAARQPAPAPAAAAPEPTSAKMTLAERVSLKEAIDRIDPPGKPPAASLTAPARKVLGLVVTKTSMETPEPRGQSTNIEGPLPVEPERRALGSPQGELLDLTPTDADEKTMQWEMARMALETDLAIARCPQDSEGCWLVLASPGRPLLYLHRLPWSLYDSPPTKDVPF